MALLLHERQVRAQSAALIGVKRSRPRARRWWRCWPRARRRCSRLRPPSSAPRRSKSSRAWSRACARCWPPPGRYAVETTAAGRVRCGSPCPATATRLVRLLTLRDENVAALWPAAPRPGGHGWVRSATVRRGCSRPWAAGPTRRSFTSTRSRSARPRATSWCSRRPGGGKSTLVMHLLGIGEVSRPSQLYFRFGRARASWSAMGGIYRGLRRSPSTLDVGLDTPANRRPRRRGVEDDDGEKGPDDEETFRRRRHGLQARSAGADPERDLRTGLRAAWTPLRRAMAAWVTTAAAAAPPGARDERAPR